MSAADDPGAIPTEPDALAASMVRLLDVAPTGENLFQGARKPGGVGRIFGGQVIGQALMSATKTVDPSRIVHSLHAYFMRPGDEDHPIDFRVEADFEGGSFSNRRVVAMQKGKPILNLVASFQIVEPGLDHVIEMPDVAAPEGLISTKDYARAHPDLLEPDTLALLLRPSSVEIRAVGIPAFFPQTDAAPVASAWFRTVAPLNAGPAIERAALAMMSDYVLLGTAIKPHRARSEQIHIQTASIDHAFWLHAEPKVDEWMLYTTQSPWSGNARGLAQGSIFSRDGKLIATVAQEGLIRPKGK